LGGAGNGLKIDPAALSQIISGLPSTSKGQKRSVVDLSGVLSRGNVQEAVLQNADRLLPHVPEQDKSELQSTVGAPQFQQAADFFGHAFQTGQLAPALQQFGIPEDAVNAAHRGDLVEFAKKLTEAEGGATKKDAKELNEQINAEAAAEETNESAINEPKAKRGKTEDNMDLD
jgi:26S proteasome regulatory subunit N13